MNYPIEDWERAAEGVKERFSDSKARPRFDGNPMAELAPELATLVQTLARGRSYADPTIDLKTRALLTVACLVGLGEQKYIETWIANAMAVGATRDEIVELIIQLFTYVGTPKAVAGFAAAKAVFDEVE
jgi:4-carboxymuconolactone decarboxylase